MHSASSLPKPIRSTYIAGPMRGVPRLNFPAFYEAEEGLRSLGYTVLNPARMDILRDPGLYHRLDSLSIPDGLPADKEIIDRDVQAILTLVPGRDDIHMLPGWQKSKGACAEKALAEWIGLEVKYL